MLERFDLKYADIIAVHQNGHIAKLWKTGIWAYCKFLIWCFKGDKDKPTKFHDLSNFIESQPVNKYYHDWEQSTVEAIHNQTSDIERNDCIGSIHGLWYHGTTITQMYK